MGEMFSEATKNEIKSKNRAGYSLSQLAKMYETSAKIINAIVTSQEHAFTPQIDEEKNSKREINNTSANKSASKKVVNTPKNMTAKSKKDTGLLSQIDHIPILNPTIEQEEVIFSGQLTETQKRNIRAMYATGEYSINFIAKKFKIDRTVVYQVVFPKKKTNILTCEDKDRIIYLFNEHNYSPEILADLYNVSIKTIYSLTHTERDKGREYSQKFNYIEDIEWKEID